MPPKINQTINPTINPANGINPIPVIFLLAAASLAGGCGVARVVQRGPAGGVLALQGTRDEAMKDAHLKMSGHCGPGSYSILNEGEEVVGSQTRNSEEAKATKKGTVVNEGSSQTVNVTEWRISYQCGAPPAMAYPGYAPAPPGYPAAYPPPPAPAVAPGVAPAVPPPAGAIPAGYGAAPPVPYGTPTHYPSVPPSPPQPAPAVYQPPPAARTP